MKKPAAPLRNEIQVLFYALRQRRVPALPKMVAALSLLYLLSPIDLVPDFIPFAGWLDDLVIVPLLLHFSYRLLPAAVVREGQIRAGGQRRKFRRLALLLLLVVVATMVAIYWYYHRHSW